MSNNDVEPDQLTPAQFADKVGYSKRTLRRWDKEKLFKARRTPGGEPFYLEEDVKTVKEGQFQ